MWKTIKFLFAAIAGCVLSAGFFDILFDENMFFYLVRFICNWVWCSYCWNFYYPRKNNIAPKKDDDNEIDFKDLK